MNHCQLDIGAGGLGKALIVAGKASAAPDPAERPFDHPASRQHFEAADVVGAFHDLEAPEPLLGEERVQSGPLVGAIGPDQIKPGEEIAQAGKHEESTIAVLDVRRVDNGVQDEALRIDDNVALASLDFLARVVTHRGDRGPPFSADLTD